MSHPGKWVFHPKKIGTDFKEIHIQTVSIFLGLPWARLRLPLRSLKTSSVGTGTCATGGFFGLTPTSIKHLQPFTRQYIYIYIM